MCPPFPGPYTYAAARKHTDFVTNKNITLSFFIHTLIIGTTWNAYYTYSLLSSDIKVKMSTAAIRIKPARLFFFFYEF